MLLRALLIALSGNKTLKRFFTHSRFTRGISQRFVSGLDIEAALPAVKALNELGIRVTMDHLGENVDTEEEARAASAEAIKIYEVLQREKIDGNVSIKLTQMGMDIGEEFCRENVAGILDKAVETENFLRIDMEGSEYTQRTLDLFFDFRKQHENVGIVIQSCLFRSEQDIKDILAAGGRVRLCKGAYREPANISFKKKKDNDANFVRLTKMLLDSGIYNAIGTHDEKMIEATIRHAAQNNIPRESFEFQMLYGIRRDLQKQLVEDGYNMRTYVPYGYEWYPYFMRRLAERPANVLFILKNFFKK